MPVTQNLWKASLIATLACAPAPGALAQSSSPGDVVVMRRVVAKPTNATHIPDQPVEDDGRWVEGAWQWTGFAACTDRAPRSRAVTCMTDDKPAEEARCRLPKPATTDFAERRDGCTFDWRTGDYGAWSSTCADPATRTRAVQCLRSDGIPAPDDGICTGPKPDVLDEAEQISGCAWEDRGWNNTSGCGAVTEQRDVACRDTSSGAQADPSLCLHAAEAGLIGDLGSLTRSATDYSACSDNEAFDKGLKGYEEALVGRLAPMRWAASRGGRSGVAYSIPGGNVAFQSTARYPIVSDDQKFEIALGIRQGDGDPDRTGAYLGIVVFNAAGVRIPNGTSYGFYPWGANLSFSDRAWQDRKAIIGKTAASVFRLPADAAFFSPLVYLNNGNASPNASYEVDYFTVREVTQE
ncbi:hypothetical protein G432_12235 [Sphingomonas sp. MM-1]|uniref:hypothetical protein n=1 Tax=Sphingomonas sp. MM-1 TaxID=745310 RepID=UPI0002C0C2D5|nr:hypothetical protein [Sphingomonas sp. MM-1]AGH50168.1 hypothetical protein G432_12235 [Sphingomonas sp. MM-1]